MSQSLDQELIEKYIGKHLLIGITYLNHEGGLIEQKQMHGTIVRINESEGLVVQLDYSEEFFALPPALHSIQEAPPGDYRLRSTGEVVSDPDYLTTWTITKPKPKEA
jgi:hypothetical protein